jgi:hypothetical protein
VFFYVFHFRKNTLPSAAGFNQRGHLRARFAELISARAPFPGVYHLEKTALFGVIEPRGGDTTSGDPEFSHQRRNSDLDANGVGRAHGLGRLDHSARGVRDLRPIERRQSWVERRMRMGVIVERRYGPPRRVLLALRPV